MSSFAFGDNFHSDQPALVRGTAGVSLPHRPRRPRWSCWARSPMVSALVLHSFVFSLAILLCALRAREATHETRRGGRFDRSSLLAGVAGLRLDHGRPSGDDTRSHHMPGARPWRSPGMRTRSRPRTSRFLNVFFSLLYPQRSFLLRASPVAPRPDASHERAVREQRHGRNFVGAGIVAGLLPFAHLGSLLAMALITPFLFLLFPAKRWFWLSSGCGS